MKKLITWLLFLPTLIMADAVIFSGSDVKALKQNLDLFGVVKVMSGTVDPSAGGGVAAPVGSAYLSTVHGLFLKTGASNTAWTKNALLPVDLTAQVTGILPPANGGTGSSVVPSNGQIPIGNGTNYAPSTITGTANQVSVTNGAGSITLTTPQDIATTSDVQFDEVTLNNAAYGPLNVGDKINRLTGTYLISGGVLSVNANPALFNLSAGVGYVADKSNPASPTLKTVTWGAFTGVTVANLATADVTYILINDTGNIVQQTTYPTAQQRRDNIFIGRLPHINRTNISFALSLAEYGQGGINQLYDLFDSLGPFRVSGLNVSANGANLKINLSSGEMFSRSYNYPTTPENPNEVAITGSTASTFRYGTQTTFIQTNVTDINPASYDNAGTVTTVPSNNNATIQRVYLFPTGAIRIYYGQNVYTNFAAAIDNFSNDSFVENQNSQNFATHIASIIITKTCSSLQNTTCSRIVNTGKFGSSGSTGGGSATLQQAYNNSTAPQITTSTSGGSLDIRRGSAADTDNVLRIQNGSGSTTATITGAGVITGSNLSGTNTGDDTLGTQEAGVIGTFKDLSFPNYQVVETNSTTKQFGIDTGNKNELYNGSFEAQVTTVGWITSNATPSANTTAMFEGKKSLSLALTGALSLSQSSTINAAQKSGVQMVASIWVNSSDVSDLQLCSLKNGAEDKCTVVGGYVQGSGWRQLTVSFLGDSTSNGLLLKSTDTTGTVLVDQAFVGIGSPIVNLSIDPESISYTGYLSKSGSSVRFKTLSGNSSGNLITSDNTTFTKFTALKRVTATACYAVTYSASRSDTQVVLYNSSGAIRKTWEGFYIQSGSTGGANAVCGTSIMEIGDYFVANESTATPTDATSTNFSITANALDVSKAYVASGSVALNTTEFSAKGTTTSGTITEENTDWISGNGTAANGTVITFVAGKFTVAPNCQAAPVGTSTAVMSISGLTANSVTVTSYNPSTLAPIASQPFVLTCQKQGADYQAAFNPVIVGSFEGIEKCATANECNDTFSAKVSSAGVVTGENTDWINGTCSTVTGSQNFGTTCNFASNIFTVAPNCLVSLNKEFDWTGGIQTVTNSSVSYTVSSAGSGSAGTDVYLICQKTGADYFPKTAKVAVSTGVNRTDGVERPEIFSVSYGKTATTVCDGTGLVNTNQCAYLDQIGNAVTSITRSGTGDYALNTSKTYSKLKCGWSGTGPNQSLIYSSIACSSCSSVSFSTVGRASGVGEDTRGTLLCQGIPQ